MRTIPPEMLRLEMVRELATLAMLAALSAIVAEGFLARLSVFFFTFGVWDLCYYAFLRLLLDWPRTLMDWDVLFLIPVTWLAPVLAPVVCSLTMICLALLWNRLDQRSGFVRIGRGAWLLMAAGAGLIFTSFLRGSVGLLARNGLVTAHVVPTRYAWDLFAAGEALVLWSAAAVYRKNRAR